jgi:3-hydroxybutyryl-CoA dehydratase
MGLLLENLEIGMSARFTRVVTDADVQAFADLSGDTNPIHLDDSFAASSLFKKRIVHGIFYAGFISTLLGTTLPGPGAIYLYQTLEFKRPVFIGDAVTASVEIISKDTDSRIVILKTDCKVDEKLVLTGEAKVLIPEK